MSGSAKSAEQVFDTNIKRMDDAAVAKEKEAAEYRLQDKLDKLKQGAEERAKTTKKEDIAAALEAHKTEEERLRLRSQDPALIESAAKAEEYTAKVSPKAKAAQEHGELANKKIKAEILELEAKAAKADAEAKGGKVLTEAEKVARFKIGKQILDLEYNVSYNIMGEIMNPDAIKNKSGYTKKVADLERAIWGEGRFPAATVHGMLETERGAQKTTEAQTAEAARLQAEQDAKNSGMNGVINTGKQIVSDVFGGGGPVNPAPAGTPPGLMTNPAAVAPAAPVVGAGTPAGATPIPNPPPGGTPPFAPEVAKQPTPAGVMVFKKGDPPPDPKSLAHGQMLEIDGTLYTWNKNTKQLYKSEVGLKQPTAPAEVPKLGLGVEPIASTPESKARDTQTMEALKPKTQADKDAEAALIQQQIKKSLGEKAAQTATDQPMDSAQRKAALDGVIAKITAKNQAPAPKAAAVPDTAAADRMKKSDALYRKINEDKVTWDVHAAGMEQLLTDKEWVAANPEAVKIYLSDKAELAGFNDEGKPAKGEAKAKPAPKTQADELEEVRAKHKGKSMEENAANNRQALEALAKKQGIQPKAKVAEKPTEVAKKENAPGAEKVEKPDVTVKPIPKIIASEKKSKMFRSTEEVVRTVKQQEEDNKNVNPDAIKSKVISGKELEERRRLRRANEEKTDAANKVASSQAKSKPQVAQKPAANPVKPASYSGQRPRLLSDYKTAQGKINENEFRHLGNNKKLSESQYWGIIGRLLKDPEFKKLNPDLEISHREAMEELKAFNAK